MGVDEFGVDKFEIDEMRCRRSGMKPHILRFIIERREAENNHNVMKV